jgi:EAL domain-containing protein (putative c-di-GMP-specific phosphodiesterase class I)
MTIEQGEVPSVQEAMDGDFMKVVFQPILDLSQHKPFGYECLVRCKYPGLENPLRLFELAVEQGLTGELGRLLRRLAIDHAPDECLFINLHPTELAGGWLVRPDDAIFEHSAPIYLEITESVPLTHFDLCDDILRELRHKGMHIAVDDLGAGYSNLKYITDLAPDIVKLDRELVRNISHDKRLLILVRHMIALCEDLGAKVVAEGIETEEELGALRAIGAHYGQGYFIARPAFPLPSVVRSALDAPEEG